MEHYKISNVLSEGIKLKYFAWIELNDLSRGQYLVNKNMRLKTSTLRPDLCDYSHVYIVINVRITVVGTADPNERSKNLISKNNDPFISCLSEINNAFIDNAKNLDILKLMYNMNENNAAGDYRINNSKTATNKYFEYKPKIKGDTAAGNKILDTEVVISLKYSNNFWRFLNFSLIKCEVEHDLSWPKNYVMSEISRATAVSANPNAKPPVQTRAATQATETIFQITSSKLHAPVVTLPINDNIKFFENIK